MHAEAWRRTQSDQSWQKSKQRPQCQFWIYHAMTFVGALCWLLLHFDVSCAFSWRSGVMAWWKRLWHRILWQSRSVFSSSWIHVLKNNQSLNSFARSKGQTKVSTWMAWSFHSDQFNIHQCGCSRDAQGGVHLLPLADMTFGFPVGLLAMPKKLARRSWISVNI